jgi:hypothetical protein
MLILFLVFSSFAAPPPAADIQEAFQSFNRGAIYELPSLNAQQIETLRSGKVVKVLDRQGSPTQPRRATGILLSSTSRDQLWLSCQDLHFQQQESTTELRVSLQPPDKAVWYGFLDLPWPFDDRHWVVDVYNNHSLAQSTNNSAWEHPWTLASKERALTKMGPIIAQGKVEGVDSEMFQSAIYTPANRGAWFAIDLGEYAIFGYHATTVVGGNVPENLISQFVLQGLDKLLKDIETRAEKTVPSHYTSGHKGEIIGGDGKPMPYF